MVLDEMGQIYRIPSCVVYVYLAMVSCWRCQCYVVVYMKLLNCIIFYMTMDGVLSEMGRFFPVYIPHKKHRLELNLLRLRYKIENSFSPTI